MREGSGKDGGCKCKAEEGGRPVGVQGWQAEGLLHPQRDPQQIQMSEFRMQIEFGVLRFKSVKKLVPNV